MDSIGNTSDEDICATGEAQITSGKEVNIDGIENFLAKLKENAEESSEKNDKKAKGEA